jgi:MoaA/NifB/PqqE/SkfB family radical SAM enzyme
MVVERELFDRRFVVEGNLEDFVAYFRHQCGTGQAPPRRSCRVAMSRLVVSPDGAIRPCFFLDPLSNLEATAPGDVFQSQAAVAFRAGFDATSDARCERCHQFRDWSF